MNFGAIKILIPQVIYVISSSKILTKRIYILLVLGKYLKLSINTGK